MKKFLIIALSAVFVLGLAATAFAIHAEIPSETQAVVATGETQITLGGSIRIRGEVRDADLDNTTNASSWFDERVRLSVAAKVSDDVSGLIMIESDSSGADSYKWGANDAASGVYGKGNAKPTDLHILQAWILYKNDFLNLKIGHMPLALGNKIFFDHTKFGDDAIVLYKDIDNTHLAAILIKIDEGETDESDDANAYVALFAHKGDGFNISGDITWVNDDSFGDGANSRADLYNIGLRVDTTLGSLKLKGDVEFQTGDVTDGTADFANMCGVADCDFAGYALVGSVSADLDSMTVAIEAGYGSGDDTADGDIDLFINSLNSAAPYIAFVHGTRTDTNNPANAYGGTTNNNGISNLTYLKGSVSGSLADNVTGKADIIWLQASERGSAPSDDIGVEIDAKITYKVAKNLVYWIEGGYLFSDDYYGVNSDDAYALRHGIQLSF